jgi:Cu-processing system ATP-binding protein
MIELIDVNKHFGKLQVLKGINARFTEGECIALIGPNGCGKTTLIKSILGMVIPDSGDILINEKSIRNQFEYRKQIGYMPQIGRYPQNMTIGQVISMIQTIRTDVKICDTELLEQFFLTEMYDKRMHTLSGGTTQKVSATLAFLFNPQILILDEPTAGLDPLAADILKDKIVQEKKNGKLILITSHLLDELDELITQVIYMQDGEIVFHKNVSDLNSETGTTRVSRAISQILKTRNHEAIS